MAYNETSQNLTGPFMRHADLFSFSLCLSQTQTHTLSLLFTPLFLLPLFLSYSISLNQNPFLFFSLIHLYCTTLTWIEHESQIWLPLFYTLVKKARKLRYLKFTQWIQIRIEWILMRIEKHYFFTICFYVFNNKVYFFPGSSIGWILFPLAANTHAARACANVQG